MSEQEIEVRLPRLVVTRDAAEALLKDHASGTCTRAVVRARAVSAVSQTFADQFLYGLQTRGIRAVRVSGAPTELMERLRAAADWLGGVVDVGPAQRNVP